MGQQQDRSCLNESQDSSLREEDLANHQTTPAPSDESLNDTQVIQASPLREKDSVDLQTPAPSEVIDPGSGPLWEHSDGEMAEVSEQEIVSASGSRRKKWTRRSGDQCSNICQIGSVFLFVFFPIY